MSWPEVIHAIIVANGGQATLPMLYQQAEQYRKLPSGDWQKTLRGVLYREVRKGRYERIGLGVFALPEQAQRQSQNAYHEAAQGQSYLEYLSQQTDLHGAVQGMLLEIGNYLGYLTYTSDKNRAFDGKPLSSLCGLQKIPEFSYKDIVQITSFRDVVWFTNTRRPFPKYVYDVENTTDFDNSMQQMYQLQGIDTRFVLVAEEKKRKLFEQKLQREPFVQIASRYAFRSYEQVVRFYFSCVEHYELRLAFLDM
ncbi:MAG: hypothetical protein NZM28_05305 [Fimbriimonadales bacterium]|nr:hypothetical protein [Fimbriimonadales bacterium]